MKILVGRIIRGTLRRLIRKVSEVVEASRSSDAYDMEENPMVQVVKDRITSHPNFEAIRVYPTAWGGFGLDLDLDGYTHHVEADSIHEVLAFAMSISYEDDA